MLSDNDDLTKSYSDTSIADYASSIRSAVYGLWSGRLDINTFIESILATVRRGFTRAWYEGASQCGVTPTDLTFDEQAALSREIGTDSFAVIGFGQFIQGNAKQNGGKFLSIEPRMQMWINRYSAVKSHAMQMACKDKKLKWVMNPQKEHCATCLSLDGRVYRASVWEKYGLRPRIRSLQCGGWRCGCEFVPTVERVTPGFPPRVGI